MVFTGLKKKNILKFVTKYKRLPKDSKELSMFILYGSIKGEK